METDTFPDPWFLHKLKKACALENFCVFPIRSAHLTKGYLLPQTRSSPPNCHKQCEKTDTLSVVSISLMLKAKPSPLYPTRDIFWERSKCQPQHYSLLKEGATTSWQKSYGTNSSNSIPPFIFHEVFFVSLMMFRMIFHSHIICCSQQCSAEMTVLAESPFTASESDTKYCGVQRFQVSIISQDMCKLTPGMGIGDFK